LKYASNQHWCYLGCKVDLNLLINSRIRHFSAKAQGIENGTKEKRLRGSFGSYYSELLSLL
jgi:hypothetical protein